MMAVRFADVRAWFGHAREQVVSTFDTVRNMMRQSSAATTSTMSGSSGIAAYASPKIWPDPRMPITLTLPQTSTLSMRTEPSSTSPTSRMRSPIRCMRSPVEYARSRIPKHPSIPSISSTVDPWNRGVAASNSPSLTFRSLLPKNPPHIAPNHLAKSVS